MSMFDWVVFSMPCPKCRALVDGFQSKDGPRDLQVLLPHTVTEMTGWCPNPKCDTVIHFVDGRQTFPTYDAGTENYPDYLPVPPYGAKP